MLSLSVSPLSQRNVIVTGASRGIGRAIAMQCAREGANVGLLARSDDTPHHSALSGTLQCVATEMRNQGASVMVMAADVGDFVSVKHQINAFHKRFGGIDAIVNNASMLALDKTPAATTCAAMLRVNVLGVQNIISASFHALKQSVHGGHVVTISPPTHTLDKKYLLPHPLYTSSKYAMTMVTHGYADELCCNTVWPRKMIRTAATRRIERVTGVPAYTLGLPPETFALAVCKLLHARTTGNSYFDDELVSYDAELWANGIDDVFV